MQKFDLWCGGVDVVAGREVGVRDRGRGVAERPRGFESVVELVELRRWVLGWECARDELRGVREEDLLFNREREFERVLEAERRGLLVLRGW